MPTNVAAEQIHASEAPTGGAYLDYALFSCFITKTVPVAAALGGEQSSDLSTPELRNSGSGRSVRPTIQKLSASGNPRMLQFSQ